MADIKQAAKWMQEGHTVQRKKYATKFWSLPKFSCSARGSLRISYDIVCADGCDHTLDLFDLQADDWEIAEEPHA